MIDAYIMTAGGIKKPVRSTGGSIRIRRDRMDMGHGETTARHLRHAWEFEESRFVVMKIDSRVTVRLEREDESCTIGPFSQLWIVGSLILSDLDQEHPVAEFQYDSRLWQSSNGENWESIVFIEAD